MLGLGPLPKSLPPVPKGKFVIRGQTLPPEEGWFDPATLNDDTEPPPTARLDVSAVDASDVELSDDSFDDTVELPFSAALVSAFAPGIASIPKPARVGPAAPPPLPPEAAAPPHPKVAVPPTLPVHASTSSLPPTAEMPQWAPIRSAPRTPVVSRPPMMPHVPPLDPKLTDVPSSPWVDVPTDLDQGPPVYEVADEPSGDRRISSAAVFVSRRPAPPAPRKGAGVRYAFVGLVAAAAVAAIGWGWHKRTSSHDRPAMAQASLAHDMPAPVIEVAPPAEPQPEAPPPCAPLEVKSAAPGYRVLVDGKPMGPAPGTFELDCGDHTVALMNGGRGVLSKTIRRVEVGEKPTVVSYTWPDVAP